MSLEISGNQWVFCENNEVLKPSIYAPWNSEISPALKILVDGISDRYIDDEFEFRQVLRSGNSVALVFSNPNRIDYREMDIRGGVRTLTHIKFGSKSIGYPLGLIEMEEQPINDYLKGVRLRACQVYAGNNSLTFKEPFFLNITRSRRVVQLGVGFMTMDLYPLIKESKEVLEQNIRRAKVKLAFAEIRLQKWQSAQDNPPPQLFPDA